MAIIYTYPEINQVEGEDLLLISDTSLYKRPTRSVTMDNLAAYVGTVIGIGFWNLGTAPDSIFTTKMASIGQDANIASSKLNVYKTDDMTASVPHVATFNESLSNHSLNLWPSPGNNSADIYGSVSRGTFTGSGTVDQIKGIESIGRHSGSGSVNIIQGTHAAASLTGAGSVKTIAASYAKTFIEGTGSNNIENAFGAWNVVELDGLNDVDTIYGTYSNVVLTNGEVNDDAIGHFIGFDQVSADTEINNAYYIHAINNSLSVTGEKFFIKDETGIPSQFSNKLVLNAYGSGTFTGTATQRLAVDTNGNVIEIPIGSGPVDGSGTANYSARWIDTDTLGIGALYDNGNYVGIGTNNPTNKLHVYNGITRLDSGSASSNALGVYSNFSNTAINLFAGSTGSGFISVNSSGMNLGAPWNGGTKVSILNNGNVGIGTTSPSEKLEVVGNIKASSGTSYASITPSVTTGSVSTKSQSVQGAMVSSVSSGNTSASQDVYTGVNIGSFNGAGTVTIGAFNYGNVDYQTGHNSFTHSWYGSRANNPWLTLNATGLGIGTTSPSEKLDVEGNARVGQNNGFYINNQNVGIKRDSNDLVLGGFGNVIIKSSNTTVVNQAERMRITSAGNVGIGTTNPTTNLQLGAFGTADQEFRIESSGNSYFSVLTTNGVQKIYAGGAGTQSNEMAFYTSNSGAEVEAMRITSTGNIGIGTNSPASIMEINGGSGNGVKITAANAGTEFVLNASTSNGTSRLWVGGNGNVGIGTTSPDYLFEVEKTTSGSATLASFKNTENTGIRISRTGASPGTSVFNVVNNGALYTSSDSHIAFQPGNSTSVFMQSTGNVGIGTTSPSEKLHVVGNIKLNDNNKLLVGTGSDLQIYNDGVASNIIDSFNNTTLLIRQHYLNGNISFQTDDGSGGVTTYLKLDGSTTHAYFSNPGNVGIGTSSPGRALDIVAGNGSQFRVSSTTANNTLKNAYHQVRHYNNSEQDFVWALAQSNSSVNNLHLGGSSSLGNAATSIAFFTASNNTTTTGSQRMTISNAGNVGIGTTSPGTKLHVSGGIITVNDGTGITYYEGNKINSYNVSGYTIIGRDGLTLSTASADKDIILSPTGNVGIGTTSPGAKLSVNGNVKIEGTNSLLFGGSASIPSWAINHNGSDLLIDDQGGNIGSVLFNNSEGVALPRLTTTEINAISLPAQGLMAYNTTLNTICFYNGSSWQKVSHTSM